MTNRELTYFERDVIARRAMRYIKRVKRRREEKLWRIIGVEMVTIVALLWYANILFQ